MSRTDLTVSLAGVMDWFTIFLAIITLFLVFRFKINSAWLILGGGLLRRPTSWRWVDIGGDTF
jgi:chromate transporter